MERTSSADARSSRLEPVQTAMPHAARPGMSTSQKWRLEWLNTSASSATLPKRCGVSTCRKGTCSKCSDTP